MNISAIAPGDVSKIWPEIRGGLANLLATHGTGKWTVGDVYENLELGDWQLFIVSDQGEVVASLVCSIQEGARKTLEIGLCWGRDAAEWTGDMCEAFDQVGRELGCDQMALDGRPGWRQVMRQLGFKHRSSTYTRPINGQH